MNNVLPTRLLGVAAKAYLDMESTQRWLEEIAARSALFAAADLFVVPSLPALPMARGILAGTGVVWAAQNVHWQLGAFTGEVSAEMLAELGCSYVEVGHPERRALFAETDRTTARKARAVTDAGMTPIVYVGESEYRAPDDAARIVRSQLSVVLELLEPDASVIVAYAPVWAAAPAHIASVLKRLKRLRRQWSGPLRVICGGAAGPGTYTALRAVQRRADGALFGRAAHNVDVLAQVADAASVRAN